MGLVRMGPPTELILQLMERYELRNFIETGTYYGNTAVWAASHFDNVITIEYSREIYEETIARHGKIQNINFMFGDSRAALQSIVSKLTRPAIFWLDSHWSGGKTYGQNDECPLIEEILAIVKSKRAHFVFIDDARLFMSPPPRPNRIEQWPSIDEVIEAIKSGSHKYYIVLFEDVIIAVPEYVEQDVAAYCQDISTKAWEEYGKRLNESVVRQGCSLIGQGLGLLSRAFFTRVKRPVSNLAKGVMRR